MAERKPEIRAQSQAREIVLKKKHTTLEVLTIDDADTVTVDIMTTIDNAKAINLEDGSDVTVDVLGNVLTVNDVAVSGSHLLITVVGS
jgi:hypothetical protein